MRGIDRITSFLLIALSILGLIATLGFKRESYLLPRIILSGIIFFSLMMLANTFSGADKSRPKIEISWKPLMIIVCLTLGYILSIQFLGFYPATVLYIFITLVAFGMRKPLILICLPTSFAIGIYLIFTVGFSIYLPGGPLF